MPRCMCHGHECADEYHSAHSENDPSHETWETAETCSIGCHSPSTPITTPPRQYRDFTPPGAPLREITRRPDLRSGMAIARRRLDFDTISSIEFPDDDDELPLGGDELYDGFLGDRRRAVLHSTAIYDTERRPRFPSPPGQVLPRMTRRTPCGKCLRM